MNKYPEGPTTISYIDHSGSVFTLNGFHIEIWLGTTMVKFFNEYNGLYNCHIYTNPQAKYLPTDLTLCESVKDILDPKIRVRYKYVTPHVSDLHDLDLSDFFETIVYE